jgi:hypothetical protein
LQSIFAFDNGTEAVISTNGFNYLGGVSAGNQEVGGGGFWVRTNGNAVFGFTPGL